MKIEDNVYLIARNLRNKEDEDTRVVMVYIGDREIERQEDMLWVYETVDGADRGVVTWDELISMYRNAGLLLGQVVNDRARPR